jgi:hypothetical protein
MHLGKIVFNIVLLEFTCVVPKLLLVAGTCIKVSAVPEWILLQVLMSEPKNSRHVLKRRFGAQLRENHLGALTVRYDEYKENESQRAEVE